MSSLLVCADAGPTTGTGHLRRMLTLSEALLAHPDIRGVTLLSSDLGADIATRAGLPGLSVRSGTCDPDGVKKTLQESDFAGVVLDNYHWDAQTEMLLRPEARWIAVVDDLADRPHAAEVLIDHNAHHGPQDYASLVRADTLVLAGADFCLLSAPFRAARAAKRMADPAGDGPVFVSLGGGDPHGDMLPLVTTLLNHTALPLTIATGSHIADARALADLASAQPDRVELVFDSPRVADQMGQSRMAVAAGGTMIWERAALGLPSLCLILADNQQDCVNWLAERGVHEAFDLRGDWSDTELAARVQDLARDVDRRARYASASARLIDGQGAVRLAEALVKNLQQDS